MRIIEKCIIMENVEENKFYKPNYSRLFNKIKDIRTPVKNEILIALLDGQWHSELELIRLTRKNHEFVGPVTIGTMIGGVNNFLKKNYVEKRFINGVLHYRISENYVGLSRAAYRYDPRNFF